MPDLPSAKATLPPLPTATLGGASVERASLYQASLWASLDAEEHGPSLPHRPVSPPPPPAYTPYDEAPRRADERRPVHSGPSSAERLSAPRAVQVRAASGTTTTSGPAGGSARKSREEKLKTTVGRMMNGGRADAEDQICRQPSTLTSVVKSPTRASSYRPHQPSSSSSAAAPPPASSPRRNDPQPINAGLLTERQRERLGKRYATHGDMAESMEADFGGGGGAGDFWLV